MNGRVRWVLGAGKNPRALVWWGRLTLLSLAQQHPVGLVGAQWAAGGLRESSSRALQRVRPTAGLFTTAAATAGGSKVSPAA